jgi:hypothetical protein
VPRLARNAENGLKRYFFLLALNTQATWLRVLTWALFLLTAASTIVTGEHYYIDLVAAVPFCLGIQKFAEKIWPRDLLSGADPLAR